MKKGHHETTTPEKTTWRTPLWIRDTFGVFGLDPCACSLDPTRMATLGLTEADNGLETPWGNDIHLAFVNPPFGRGIEGWLDKVLCEGVDTLFLCPARVETRWFHEYIWNSADGVLFFNKRVQYVDPATDKSVPGAGFPSCLVAFGREALGRMISRGSTHGKIVVLR